MKKKKWLIAVPVIALAFGAVSCTNDDDGSSNERCYGTTYAYDKDTSSFWKNSHKTLFEKDSPKCGGTGQAAKQEEKQQLEERLKELEQGQP